ncbi:MAG: galactose ABC transporter substrate-binding protein [Clostridiales bacterium]|nr:galactose ABC transporter substrate-binding protein [Clostridiales bacterium]
MKRLLTLILVLIAAACLVLQPAMAEAKPKIGVLIFDYSNAYVSYIRNSIENECGDTAELLMVDAQNDQSKQVEQVDNLIQRGVDAIAINAVAPESASIMIEKIAAAGIPVVFFNRCPSETDLNSYERCYYVGTTPEQSGEMQAEMAWKAFQADPTLDKNGDGKLQYVIIKGTPGHPDAEARTEANQYTFANLGASVELLDVQTGQFKTAEAKDVMDAWIGKYQDGIEMVLTNSDAMTLGAYESLTAANLKSGIVGINALPEVLPLIEDGSIIGSILSDAAKEGRCIFRMCYNLATGADVLTNVEGEFGTMKDIRVPYIPIDNSNLNVARDIYASILD